MTKDNVIQKLVQLSSLTKFLRIIIDFKGVTIVYNYTTAPLLITEDFTEEQEGLLYNLIIKEIESHNWNYKIQATWFDSNNYGTLTRNKYYEYFVTIDNEVAISDNKLQSLLGALIRKLQQK